MMMESCVMSLVDKKHGGRDGGRKR